MDRLTKQIDFVLEIDKLKHVLRQSRVTDGSRRENDVEHSWHLAVMTMLLAEYAAEPIDVLRTVRMVLVHDIVEIDAGDTFIYSTAAREAAHETEQAAADRLFGMLPDDQASEFRALWDEFEARITPESWFARALDRLQPIMLNHANQGGPWREHNVTAEQVTSLNMSVLEQGAPKLAEFAEKLFMDAQEKGYFHEE
ncbi:MAG: HD domain-containing protein [Armatimonadetes bacterium]|nr:HD domain-containing protein [Armatimonadota bacterium]